MKYLVLVFSLLFTNAIYAQENEGLFEVEYELNGQQMKSFGYSVENCAQSLVYNTWQNWVLNKGGSFNILKKYEANNIQFKNSEDQYKVTLSIVEDSPVKLTLINTLMDQNGMYFSESNPDFSEIYERLRDLSFQTRQACVRNNLKVANESMIRVSKQNVDLQTKKGASIKSYLKANNELLKLENKKTMLIEKLDLIQNQLERASDDKKVDVLMKKKAKTEANFVSVDTKIQTLTAKVKLEEENNQGLDGQIDIVTSQLQTQRSNIETLKAKFQQIQR